MIVGVCHLLDSTLPPPPLLTKALSPLDPSPPHPCPSPPSGTDMNRPRFMNMNTQSKYPSPPTPTPKHRTKNASGREQNQLACVNQATPKRHEGEGQEKEGRKEAAGPTHPARPYRLRPPSTKGQRPCIPATKAERREIKSVRGRRSEGSTRWEGLTDQIHARVKEIGLSQDAAGSTLIEVSGTAIRGTERRAARGRPVSILRAEDIAGRHPSGRLFLSSPPAFLFAPNIFYFSPHFFALPTHVPSFPLLRPLQRPPRVYLISALAGSYFVPLSICNSLRPTSPPLSTLLSFLALFPVFCSFHFPLGILSLPAFPFPLPNVYPSLLRCNIDRAPGSSSYSILSPIYLLSALSPLARCVSLSSSLSPHNQNLARSILSPSLHFSPSAPLISPSLPIPASSFTSPSLSLPLLYLSSCLPLPLSLLPRSTLSSFASPLASSPRSSCLLTPSPRLSVLLSLSLLPSLSSPSSLALLSSPLSRLSSFLSPCFSRLPVSLSIRTSSSLSPYRAFLPQSLLPSPDLIPSTAHCPPRSPLLLSSTSLSFTAAFHSLFFLFPSYHTPSTDPSSLPFTLTFSSLAPYICRRTSFPFSNPPPPRPAHSSFPTCLPRPPPSLPQPTANPYLHPNLTSSPPTDPPPHPLTTGPWPAKGAEEMRAALSLSCSLAARASMITRPSISTPSV
ncbi:hypothetical protein C7M84_017278 [Penaeus vannamei]|uniref:Uncharacterized protein n=1 Tax=Penaeus vannamei TaxID=6689 RepID=A0A423SKL1_PENVA|nr:hypothetical protein C7M84_017278 [Penaeus vannamei]